MNQNIEINEQLQNSFENMHRMMAEKSVLNPKLNPVAGELQSLTQQQIAYVIEQYSLFPKYIVGFLTQAKNRAQAEQWTDVETALKDNIGEEQGSDSGGVSHYNLLKKGLAAELQINISATTAHAATQKFLAEMEEVLSSENPYVVLGAIYACECTAIPELTIVRDVVQAYAIQQNGRTLSDDSALVTFIATHLDSWEVGHEDDLRKACKTCTSQKSECAALEVGFENVLITMRDWWYGLQSEYQLV